jgi:hypothetical protein
VPSCLAALFGLVALCGWAPAARAQYSATSSDGPVGAIGYLDLGARYFPALPSLRLTPRIDDDLRLPEGGARLPSPGASTPMVSFGSGLAVTLSDRWVLPLAAFEFAFGVGRADRVFTSADGGVIELQPWRSAYFAGWGLGFGARWKHRRWMAQATIQPGLAGMYVKAQVASGAGADERSATALSFSLRATLEACRRLDPETRACLFASPNIYEFGLINGGVAGVRWEFGP